MGESNFIEIISNVMYIKTGWNQTLNREEDFFLVFHLKWMTQMTIFRPLVFLLLLFIVLTAASLLRDVYRSKWLHLPAGPASLPFVGGMYLLNKNKPHLALEPLIKKYGDMFTIQMGTDGPAIFVNEVNLANRLLKNPRMGDRPMFPVFKHLTVEGKADCIGCLPYGLKWKKEQRMCHAALMDVQNIALEHHASYTMDLLFKRFDSTNGKAFNPAEDLQKTMVVFQDSVTYGCQYNSLDDPNLIIQMNGLTKFIKCLVPDHPINMFPWLWYMPCEASENLKRLIKQRDDFLDEQVENQKTGNCYKHNVLNCMMNVIQDKISETEIKINAWTLNIGGATTITCSMKWLLLYLAHNPSIQNKMQEEIDSVVDEDYNSANMPLTEAVIMETMRIAPPNPFGIPHSANADIHVDNYIIPKGTSVIINLWHIHHDEKVWEDPVSFKPERFLNEDGQMIKREKDMKHFMPFAGGARPCIGRRIARSLMRKFATSVFKHYDISPAENNAKDIDFSGIITFGLEPPPYKIKISRRKC